jgi:hypothetical protein
MPKGPQGQKRPADVIGNAVKVMRITTGEETEELDTDRAKSAAAAGEPYRGDDRRGAPGRSRSTTPGPSTTVATSSAR